jgi:hypothetical protein
MPAQVVKIDLDRVWRHLGIGIRRAYVFAGLGVNAANDPQLKDFHRPGLVKVSFVRIGPESASSTAEYKREFSTWVLGNALREAIESLEICLGDVYQVCTLIEQITAKRGPSRKVTRTFERAGASGKLKGIQEAFGITSRHSSYVETLTSLRNCLTHRHGTVGASDCNDVGSNCLRVKYFRFQFEVQPSAGAPVIIQPERVEPLFVENGGMLQARIVETEKSFPLGSVISLANPDIRDVLFTVWNLGQELRSELLKHIQSRGLVLHEQDPTS